MTRKKKYCLVTTADERTWPHNKPILFLGEWCKRFSRKEKWIKLDSQTLKYHWDDRDKLRKDYGYLQEIHEVLLKDLSEQLNRIHKVNYSIRYWRILIGPWLGYFIQALFDRWSMLGLSLEEYDIDSCQILNRDINSIVPVDMKHFNCLFVDDKWNEAVYGQLLHSCAGSRMNITSINALSDDSSLPNKRLSYGRPVGALKILLSKLSGYITRKRDYFFISSYIPLVTQFKLQVRLNQMPTFWSSPQLNYCDIDTCQRKWVLDNSKSLDEFIKVASQFIPNHIPIAYIEGYKSLQQGVREVKWPKEPKAIFTSNAYIDDEVFKAWTAEMTENGTPFIIGQHGGHFGMTPFAFYEEHQIDISDKFLSWGWRNSKNSKIKPFGNIKLLNNQLKYNPNGDALMIGVSMPRYSYHLYAAFISSQWLSYFNDQCDFMKTLPLALRKQVSVRLYSHDYGWDQKLRWENEFSDLKFDLGNSPIKASLENSRLCIATYNATSYLETLAWNMPTIVFWNEEHWELNSDSKPYFDLLLDVGIFHVSPQSAAQKIIEIWDDIDSWWLSVSVQNARKKFCEQYTRDVDRPVDQLKKIFTTN